MAELDFLQHQVQSQIQTMSQQQIQALGMLSLGTDDMRDAIYKEVEHNPALIIAKDMSGTRLLRKTKGPADRTKTVRSTGAAAELASDAYQSILENQEDTRESLQDHLLSQLNMLRIPDVQRKIGTKLIGNLDANGFHILAPVSLLDKNDGQQTHEQLDEAMHIIQHLDPEGTCVTNIQESLFVQAKLCKDAPLPALFLLDGHFDFLNPPQPQKVAKKIQQFVDGQKKLFATKEDSRYENMEISEQTVTRALSFIRTLDPYPARNFGTAGTKFVSPDIYVDQYPEQAEEPQTVSSAASDDADNFEQGTVRCKSSLWKIRAANGTLPQLEVNPMYRKIQSSGKGLSASDKAQISDTIRQAEEFMQQIAFRENTILRAACVIVKLQHDFFEHGPGNLVPLRQKDVADVLGVHETTISRMANSKYLQCKWGLFEVKYFFTNAASRASSDADRTGNAADASKEKVLHTITRLLEEHRNDAKKLSDQKICDLLAQQGIQIARRTVAKYRSQLNIDSSYGR